MDFRLLTYDFFADFSAEKFPEIENKKDRPYQISIAIIEASQNKFFAVPLRSNIKHKYGFFTNKEKTKGLDFSKMLILDKKYISLGTVAYINIDERNFIVSNKNIIEKKILSYIKTYVRSCENIEIGKGNLKEKLLCKFSTLQYFHEEIGLVIK
ncbi:MAG: type III toxin-antitoxin system TenpIN family toxin [Fusobacteriaceae bacterium]